MRFSKRKILTPAPLNPRTLGSLAAWYDVSRIPAAYIDGSNRVSLIPDISGNSDVNGLVTNGVSGNSASSASSANFNVGANFCLIWDGIMPSWTPAAFSRMLGRMTTTGNQRSYGMGINTDGTLQVYVSADGGTINATFLTSTVAVGASAYTRKAVRADWVGATASCTFYTAATASGPWTQIGTVPTGTARSAWTSANAPIEVNAENGGTGNLLAGICYEAKVINGTFAGGTTVWNPVFTAANKLATSFTESSANAATVTINSSGDLGARICGERDLYQATATKQPIYSIGADGRPVVTFDGSNDYMASGPMAYELNAGNTLYATAAPTATSPAAAYHPLVRFLSSALTASANSNAMQWESVGDGTSPNKLESFVVNGSSTAFRSNFVTAPTQNRRYALASTVASTALTAYRDGAPVQAATAVTGTIQASTGYLFVLCRADDGAHGKYAFNESLLYTATQDAATVARVYNSYTRKKWGVS